MVPNVDWHKGGLVGVNLPKDFPHVRVNRSSNEIGGREEGVEE